MEAACLTEGFAGTGRVHIDVGYAGGWLPRDHVDRPHGARSGPHCEPGVDGRALAACTLAAPGLATAFRLVDDGVNRPRRPAGRLDRHGRNRSTRGRCGPAGMTARACHRGVRRHAARVRGPAARVRRLRERARGRPERVRRPTGRLRRPTERVRGPTERVRGPTARVREPTERPRGFAEPVRRLAERVRGPTARVRGPTGRVRAPTERGGGCSRRVPGPTERVRGLTERLRRRTQRVRRATERES